MGESLKEDSPEKEIFTVKSIFTFVRQRIESTFVQSAILCLNPGVLAIWLEETTGRNDL